MSNATTLTINDYDSTKESKFTKFSGNLYQKVSTGKNLLDSSILIPGTISTSSGADSSNTTYVRTLGYIPVTASTSYSFQYGQISGVTGQIIICEYNSSNTYITYQTISAYSGSKTLGSTTAYIRICFRSDSGQSASIVNAQMERGSTVTTFEEYNGGIKMPTPVNPSEIKTVAGTSTFIISNSDSTSSQNYIVENNTPLCKIGTYQDYIYKPIDTWKIHFEIGKITLDGTENWQSGSDYYYLAISEAKGTSASRPVSNYFLYGDSSGAYGTMRFGSTNSNLIFNKAQTGYSTTADWKAYLADLYANDTPVVVYYELATSQEYNLSTGTLTQQLDTLQDINGYDGTTNITVTNLNNLAIIPTFYYNYTLQTPNPSYPQNVQVVTGNNELLISGSKNLLQLKETDDTLFNGITYSIHNNVITLNGTLNTVNGQFLRGILENDIDVLGTYTMSFVTEDYPTGSCSFQLRNSENTSLFTKEVKNTLTDTKTVNGTIDKAQSSLYINVNKTFTNTKIKIQLQVGSVKTDYENFAGLQTYRINLGSIELCKIGNYQDYFYRSNGNWYKHSEIGKVVLNGTEDWSRNSTTVFSVSDLVDYMTTGDGFAPYSNYYKGENVTSQANLSDFAICLPKGSNNRIWIKNSDITTATNFKTWLSTHNTIVYYILATPTDTQITDTTLISQLENAYNNAKMYDGITNIILTSADLNPTYMFSLNDNVRFVSDSTSFEAKNVINNIITVDDYYQDQFKKANEMYGEVNKVVYAESNIEGQEAVVTAPSGDTDEQHQLVIYDNYFGYTTEKREQLIQAGTRLFGLSYMPIQEIALTGCVYLDCNDRVAIEDTEGNLIPTIPLNHIIEYNGAVKDTVSSEMSSSNEKIYENTNSNVIRDSQTEISVDRALREITSIARDVYEDDGYVNEKYTEILQDISKITAIIQNSGGLNLVKNSVMFAYDTDGNPTIWTTSDTGTITIANSAESITNGGISGHIFTLSNETVSQTVQVAFDNKTEYAFSCRVSKNAVGTGYIKIYNDLEEHRIDFANGTSYYFKEVSLTSLLPKSNYYIIELYGSADSGMTFTDVMLNVGGYKLQWQQANGETMNTQVNVNIDGVLVKSSVYEGDYTVMSPLEFAGYSNVNGTITKIFSLNKDTTEVTKLKAEKEITMAPIKIVPITTGNNKGWAFVPYGGE